jgi:hypothetical protein
MAALKYGYYQQETQNWNTPELYCASEQEYKTNLQIHNLNYIFLAATEAPMVYENELP